MLALTELRENQAHAVNLLLACSTMILQADMGQGKTYTILYAYSLMRLVYPEAKLVYITNKSNVAVVRSQLQKHFSGVPRVCTYLGPNRKIDPRAIIHLSTYDVGDELSDIEAQVLILDEVHFLRNAHTKRFSRIAKLIKKNLLYIWGMTGTLVVNRLSDLRALSALAREPFTRCWMREHRQIMHAPIELPERQQKTIKATVNQVERSIWIRDVQSERRALSRIAKERKWSSILLSKRRFIRDQCSAGSNVLVFSSFLESLDLVEEYIRMLGGLRVMRITGAITEGKRTLARQKYQAGKGHVMLCTYGAGGVGLDLSNTDVVILNDPPWTEAAREQAICRAYRHGLKNPLMVYELRTEYMEANIGKLISFKGKIMSDEFGCEGHKPSIRNVIVPLAS